jgi:predicted nucleic acid-binding Zn ribbon protein
MTERFCFVCGDRIPEGARIDRKACGRKCRVRAWRARQIAAARSQADAPTNNTEATA